MAAAIPLCIGFLTIFLHCVAAQETDGSVSVGASITAIPDTKLWLSHSGEFALGFKQLQGNDNFLLSIWYDKIPDKTIIWYPKGGSLVPSGSKVELIDGRGLVLSDPQGREVWTTKYAPTLNLAHGLITDTGNFVLVGRDSITIWDSFDHPADTMLPTQILPRGGEINSKMSKSNFSTGRFQLRLLDEGNLVLNTLDRFSGEASYVYYDSETDDYSNSTNSGEQVIFDSTGYLSILRRDGSRFDLTPRYAVPSGDYYHRATLDFDGVFTQYYYPKNPKLNTSWKVIWLVPEDICGTGKACGLNNVCSLDGNRPKCECPHGFSLPDPSYPNDDCEPDFIPSCNAGYREEQFDLNELNNIDWPGSDYASMNPSNEEKCKTSCLRDCKCAVAIYRDSQCWKKQLPLNNGKKDPSRVVKAFVKFRKVSVPPTIQNPGSTTDSSFNRKKRLAITITFSISAGLALLGLIFWGKRKMRSDADRQGRPLIEIIDKDHGGSSETSIEAPLFNLFRVSKATNNFSVDNKLGEGGFGPVYKGVLEDGKEIAVKRLSKFSRQGLNEFKNEVICIAKLQHRNLVKLLGYCIQGDETMLIYEYMPNNSLDSFIFDERRKSLLDWPLRFHIIHGIARGLLYLHQDSRLRVVHRDLKASNILLDHNMTPKISDFGLARMFKEHESEANTMRVVGTLGYISPEYAANGLFSVKSDIFSFGVLVLEIVSGKKNRGFVSEDHHHNLIGHAWRLYKEDKSLDLIDEAVGNSYSVSEVLRSIHIGLLCVQQLAEDRPSAPLVVSMLGGESSLPSPKQPGFFIKGSETVSTIVSSSRSSVNQVTLTQTEGR